MCGASLGTRVGDRRGAGGACARVARQRDGGGQRGERTRAASRRAPVRAVRGEVVAAEIRRGLADTSGYSIHMIELSMRLPRTSHCQTYVYWIVDSYVFYLNFVCIECLHMSIFLSMQNKLHVSVYCTEVFCIVRVCAEELTL